MIKDGLGCSLFGGPLRAPGERRSASVPRFRYDVRFNAAEAQRHLSSLDTVLEVLADSRGDLTKVVLVRAERYLAGDELGIASYQTVRAAYPGRKQLLRAQPAPGPLLPPRLEPRVVSLPPLLRAGRSEPFREVSRDEGASIDDARSVYADVWRCRGWSSPAVGE
jgi:hypothetical protein